jgi:hypothetical protein
VPADSLPPPSKKSESGGSALYILGFLIFAGAAAGLFVWKRGQTEQSAVPQVVTIVKTAEPPPVDPMAEPPPPPPKLEDLPPTPSAEPAPAGSGHSGATPVRAGPAPARGNAPASRPARFRAPCARARRAPAAVINARCKNPRSRVA